MRLIGRLATPPAAKASGGGSSSPPPWTFTALAVGLAGALGTFAYAGRFVRYVADDYCLASLVGHLGAVRAVTTEITTINGRYTALAAIASLEQMGTWTDQVLPAAVLVAWWGLLTWAIGQFPPAPGRRSPPGTAATMAGLIVFVTVAGTPYPFESFYWQTSVVVFTVPLVLATAWAGAVARNRWPRRWAPALNAMIGFSLAGFNETIACSLAGILSVLVIAASLQHPVKALRRRRRVLAGGLGGAIIGLVALASAPGTHARASNWQRSPVPAALQESLRDSSAFAVHFVSTHAVLLVVTLAVSALLGSHFAEGRVFPAVGPPAVLTFLSTATVLAMSYLPSALFQRNVPPDRALVMATACLTADTVLLGFLGGWRAASSTARWARRLGAGWPATPALLVVSAALMAAVVQQVTTSVVNPHGAMVAYAAKKDSQQAAARRASTRGDHEAVVPTLGDTINLGILATSTAEIGPDSEFWVNTCAAGYYDLASIRTP